MRCRCQAAAAAFTAFQSSKRAQYFIEFLSVYHWNAIYDVSLQSCALQLIRCKTNSDSLHGRIYNLVNVRK